MKAIVIIGAGHAGLTLAREIRSQDKTVPITIINQDPVQAYYKPNLSKALAMNKSPADLILKPIMALKRDLNVNIIEKTRVLKIDSEKNTVHYLAKEVEGENQTSFGLEYQSLILATGASPIELPIKGAAGNVVSVNTLQDYVLFRELIETKKRVLIIGAGFVGCEFASDLSGQGYEVSVVDRSSWPLQAVLPEPMGEEIKQTLSNKQVNWHFHSTVEEIQRDDQGPLNVQLSNKTIIQADVILSAVGLQPNTQLAMAAGLNTRKGIVIDEHCQTSAHGIYALGDCVEYNGQPLPFIAPATLAAKALAKTLTGNKTRLLLPPQPVVIKIANCPTLICPPSSRKGAREGKWQVKGSGQDLEAQYVSTDNEFCGFALLGKKTSLKGEFLSRYSSCE